MKLLSPPPNPSPPVQVPPGYPRPILFALACASRGSGKSYTVSQLIRSFSDCDAISRTFLVSPTYHTNKHYWDFAGVKPQDAYTRMDQAEDAVKDVLRKIREAKDDHDFYVTAKQAFDAQKRGAILSVAQQNLIEQLDGVMPPPVKLIRPCLVLDDLSHSKLLTNSRFFTNLCLRNRHCHPGVGLNIIVITQSVRNGLPRCLRSNVNLWLLWPTRDLTIVRNDVWPELAGTLTREAFEDIFRYATTGDDHPYLVVDMTQPDPQHIFRRKLDGPWLKLQDD